MLTKSCNLHESSPHNWVFGAVSELVDNSKDAGAETCTVDVHQAQRPNAEPLPVLTISDDGSGLRRCNPHPGPQSLVTERLFMVLPHARAPELPLLCPFLDLQRRVAGDALHRVLRQTEQDRGVWQWAQVLVHAHRRRLPCVYIPRRDRDVLRWPLQVQATALLPHSLLRDSCCSGLLRLFVNCPRLCPLCPRCARSHTMHSHAGLQEIRLPCLAFSLEVRGVGGAIGSTVGACMVRAHQRALGPLQLPGPNRLT